MYIKLIGILLIIGGCGGFGFRLAAVHKKEEKILRALSCTLDFMECELQYHLTPLPDLCRQAAGENIDPLHSVFLQLARELEDQLSPDASCCMNSVLSSNSDLPEKATQALALLGQSIGRFDMEGQIKGLELVRQECRRYLNLLSDNRENRLRGYQTLGLCAGAALAILFI